MTNAHNNLQLSIYHTRYIYISDGSRLEAPKVANGIESTLFQTSTHTIPATIIKLCYGTEYNFIAYCKNSSTL